MAVLWRFGLFLLARTMSKMNESELVQIAALGYTVPRFRHPDDDDEAAWVARSQEFIGGRKTRHELSGDLYGFHVVDNATWKDLVSA